MKKPSTPKQRVSFVLEALKVMHGREVLTKALFRDYARSAKDGSRTTKSEMDSVFRQVSGPLKSLFTRAKLDIDNDSHWDHLLFFLAWAIYQKDPGHPKEWTRKRLRELNLLVRNMQHETERSDEDCCNEIAKSGRFGDVKGATLRRKLGPARKIGLGNRKLRR